MPENREAGVAMSAFGVNPRRIGGVEMFARELSRQLGRHGWRSVLCFLAPPPEAVRQFLDLPNVALEVLPDPGRSSMRALRASAKLLRKYRPGILHLHFTGVVGLQPWLARSCGVRRVFLTDHASRPEGYVSTRAPLFRRIVARALTRPLNGIIAVSDFNARCCVARGLVPKDRVTRIYNGVDLTRPLGDPAPFRGKYGIPANRRIVLQVSWMIPEKGVQDLIEAACLVLRQDPDVHFVLAGDGAFRDQYRSQAEQAGLAEHFTWTGLVGDPLADGVYRAADIVCQASIWQEAFGWTISEGMLCGKPVVASRVGGIPEIVQDGVTGCLVTPGRPGEMAECILRLLRDEQLRRRMGAAGRQIVEQRFSLEPNVAELLRLYGIGSGPRQ